MQKLSKILIALVLAVGLCVAAQAAVTNVTVGGYTSPGNSKSFSVSKTLDFTDSYVGVSGDTYKMVNVPAGTLVLAVAYETTYSYKTVNGTNVYNAYTFDVGDGAVSTQFCDNVDGSNALGCATFTGFDSATNRTYTVPIQKYYSTNDTINVLLNAGVTNGNITIRYEGIMLKN